MLNSDPLSNVDVESFCTNGYLVVRGFLRGAVLEQVRGAVAQVAGWPRSPNKWMHHYESTTNGTCLSRTENFAPFQADLHQLICSGDLILAVSQLFGESAVLYKEKINYKFPGGGGFAPHQDAPAYDFVSINITANVAIDPANVDNGCLWFSPGNYSELLPMNDDGCLSDSVSQSLTWQPIELDTGDVVFFHSFAPHSSLKNGTESPRRSLYLTYNKLSEGNHRDAYYAARRLALQNDHGKGKISKIGHFQGKTVE